MKHVSIVIPTYCPGAYIYDCLSSIERQQQGEISYILHIFIILNGEKDPYYSEIQQYIQNQQLINVSLIYTKKRGVSNARNVGIEQSLDCDYLVFVDDDDLLSDNYLATLINAAEKNPGDIIQCSTKILKKDGQLSSDHYINNALVNLKGNEGNIPFSLFRYRAFLNSVCAKFFPISFLREVRFAPTLRVSEDAFFMFRLTPQVKDIVLESDTSYIIRERENSASRKRKAATTILNESFAFIKALTSCYFADIRRYNFLLYISRVIASFKFVFLRLVRRR